MGKLITPVQYEPAVDGLNIGKPLDLADETRQELSLPILNQNPVDKIKLPRGKFLQVDNQGALLIRDAGGYKNIVEGSVVLNNGGAEKTFDFGRIVKRISCYVPVGVELNWVDFTASDFIAVWARVSALSWLRANFYGRYLYLRGIGGVDMRVTVLLFGLY